MKYYVIATPDIVDAITNIHLATDQMNYLDQVVQEFVNKQPYTEQELTDVIHTLTTDLSVINGCMFSIDPFDYMIQHHTLEQLLLNLYFMVIEPHYLIQPDSKVEHIQEIELHGHTAIVWYSDVHTTHVRHRGRRRYVDRQQTRSKSVSKPRITGLSRK